MKPVIRFLSHKIDRAHPITYLDVGAMGGIPHKWKSLSEMMKVIAFEPDPREFAKLQNNDRIQYLNYALYDKSCDLNYYIARESGKSSILRPNKKFLSVYENEERFHILKEEHIPSARVKSLDIIAEEFNIVDVDFIKLDTQGSELYILRGGEKYILPAAFGAQIEVEFSEMYERQPLFRDVDEFMEKRGFSLIDLRRAYWKRKDFNNYRGKGQLIFGDALYLKHPGHFFNELSKTKDVFYVKSKIFKSVLICLTYRMFDYAISLIKSGMEFGYLNPSEAERSVKEIIKSAPQGIILNSRIYALIYSLAKQFVKKLRPRSHLGWADGDHEIGNIEDI